MLAIMLTNASFVGLQEICAPLILDLKVLLFFKVVITKTSS